LHSLILRVPPRNASFNCSTPHPENGFFSIRLTSKEKAFSVPPQAYRLFDPIRRRLHCFTNGTSSKTAFRITENLTLIFNEINFLSGWIFDSPLENITESYQGNKDSDVVDENTYNVFYDYFNIFSDNEIDSCDDDIEIVVEKLLHEIDSKRISKIRGSIKRSLLEKALWDLEDYWGTRKT
jgi:hypothetical protein